MLPRGPLATASHLVSRLLSLQVVSAVSGSCGGSRLGRHWLLARNMTGSVPVAVVAEHPRSELQLSNCCKDLVEVMMALQPAGHTEEECERVVESWVHMMELEAGRAHSQHGEERGD